jgi:hypothetical protein
MKIKTIILCILTIVLPLLALGQSHQIPWKAVDGGGSQKVSGAYSLWSVVAQQGGGIGSNSGLTLEGGFLPGLRVLDGATASVSQQAGSGWNMVSVPLRVADYHKTALYPGAASNAFFYSGGYAVATVMANGVGYWLQYASSSPVSVSGMAYLAETLAVLTNWNLIGPPSYPLLKTAVVANGTTVTSNYFAYKNGYGYQVADTLYPGLAYWVQVSGNGSLILGSGSLSQKLISPSVVQNGNAGHSADPLLSAEQSEQVKDFRTIAVTDANGNKRTLYFSASAPPEMKLAAFQLPPAAPDNLLDVRFATQRIVEAVSQTVKQKAFPFTISGGVYPLTVSWKGSSLRPNDQVTALDEHGKKELFRLATDGEMTIVSPGAKHGLQLVVDNSPAKDLPKVFALYQNYPNPFNPSTTITYDVPKSVRVQLRLYNVLGEEVMSLVDAVQEPGHYAVPFAGERLASGIYFYRLDAGDIQFTKKLVLMK